MNKHELYTQVAKETGKKIADATTVCEKLFEIISDVVTNGDRVYINGFGVFNQKQYKHRRIGNLANPGTTRDVPARIRMVFSPAKCLVQEFESKTTTE